MIYPDGKIPNYDKEADIYYGVISMHDVTQAWCDSSEPDYGKPEEPVECPECGKSCPVDDLDWGDTVTCRNCKEEIEVEFPDYAEPIGWYVDDGEYKLVDCLDSDIMVIKSPYFTHAQPCSPCVPEAGNLNSPDENGRKCYCLGHDWFEEGKAPYPVYSVETGEEIKGGELK